MTSPAGTADAIDELTTVDPGLTARRAVIEKERGCIVWGGSVTLSPAGDILIGVERPLDLDSEGQLIALVLSKKITTVYRPCGAGPAGWPDRQDPRPSGGSPAGHPAAASRRTFRIGGRSGPFRWQPTSRARHWHGAGGREVTAPDRQEHRRRHKNDDLDAQNTDPCRVHRQAHRDPMIVDLSEFKRLAERQL